MERIDALQREADELRFCGRLRLAVWGERGMADEWRDFEAKLGHGGTAITTEETKARGERLVAQILKGRVLDGD